jgi:Ca2+-binding RTX toxin-like protein
MAIQSETDLLPVVKGTTGDDALTVSASSDIVARAGNDTIELDASSGRYRIIGGTGQDTLYLGGESAFGGNFVLESLVSIEALEFRSGYESDMRATLEYRVPISATGRVAAFTPMTVTGSGGGDLLVIKALGGMGSATEIMLPRITFQSWYEFATSRFQSADTISLIAGDDQDYTLRANAFIGDQGVRQTLVGAGGNDRLLGSSGKDRLVDTGGTTVEMNGAGGDDALELNFRGAPSSVGGVIDGGAGFDTLRFATAVDFTGTLTSVERLSIGSSMTFTRDLGTLSAIFLGDINVDFQSASSADLTLAGAAASSLARRTSIEGSGTIFIRETSSFDASLFTVADDNEDLGTHIGFDMTGTDGDDVLVGSAARGGVDSLGYLTYGNVFHASLGNDVVDGRAGSSLLLFDDAAFANGIVLDLNTRSVQEVAPGASISVRGIDEVRGTAAADVIVGGRGNTIVDGGDGNDVLRATASAVSFSEPYLDGDSLYGGNGNDRLIGSMGGDYLHGGSGNDVLIGRGGTTTNSDWLYGEDGDDLLIGSAGQDRFDGGAGADRIRFTAIPAKADQVDIVAWTNGDGDRLEFSQSVFTGFAAPGQLGEDAFYSAASATKAHDESDRLIFDTTSGRLYYDADGTGTLRNPVPIATFTSYFDKPLLQASDIFIVA